MEITVKGLKINYVEEGSGPAVLMLHGWGSSSDVYKGFFNVLKGTHRCVALNFPGCGGSQTMSQPYTVADYADFVLEFIKVLDLDNPALIGHSHGGRVILYMTANRLIFPPKIVLLDSAGLIPKKTFKQKFRAKSFKFIKAILTLPIIKNKSQGLLEKARKHYGSADYNAAPPVLRRTLVNVVNTDLRDILHNIECPTLLIWGDKDTDTPLTDAEIIKSKIKDSGLCVLKNTGHFSFLQKPYEANAIINSFLGGDK